MQIIMALLSLFLNVKTPDLPKESPQAVGLRFITSGSGVSVNVTQMRLYFTSTNTYSAAVTPNASGIFFMLTGTLDPVSVFVEVKTISSFQSSDVYYGTSGVHCNPSLSPQGSDWYRVNASALTYDPASGLSGPVYKIHLFGHASCTP